MQTFADSKLLAQQKNVTNLFGQSTNFKLSGKSETGSAEVQPDRYNLTDGHEKAVEHNPAAFALNHFYPNT